MGIENLEDLGAKFSRDKTFCFDKIIIHEIIFDDTNDVTLFCTVPYFGALYSANFGLSFDQLNTILRSGTGSNNAKKSAGDRIATALAEKLDGEVEIPSVIEIETLYGEPFEVSNCVLYTTLYEISDNEEEADSDLPSMETDDDTEDDYEAFAFLIEDIRLKDIFDK